MANRTNHVILAGGEDLVSAGIEVAPGRAQLLYNYSCSVRGGYTSVLGYVKYDGSSISLTFTTGNGTEPQSNTSITIGGISATITSVTTSGGTWAGGDASGTIVVEQILDDTGVIGTGAATFEDGTTTATITVASNPASVTGAGSIKGVAVWDGKVIAIRADAATPTKDVMYESSTGGWSASAMGYSIAFTAGGGGSPSPIPARGDTLTEGGVTATISGVLVSSGDFETTGTAVGILYVHTIAGGSFSAGAATYGSGADAITLGGAQAATTMPVGVRYDFRQENFSGAAAGILLYGASGGGPAFEYDGNAIVFIASGAATDTPNHLEVHGNRLFLSQPDGGIYFSSPGSPTTGFTQDYTAGAVYTGSECTGMQSMVGGALAIFGPRKSKILYGNISGAGGDMELKDHSKLVGAREWTIQQLQDCYFYSDSGCTSLAQTSKFGDFTGARLSESIEPEVLTVINTAIDSLLIKNDGFYRTFFGEDGDDFTSFLTATFSAGKLIGWGRGYYSFDLTCSASGFINDVEVSFAGANDGSVYKLDTGLTHNGKQVSRAIILPYNALGDKMVIKQWRKTIVEVDAQERFDFRYSLQFNYSAVGTQHATAVSDTVEAGGALWGLGTWGEFTWSGTASYGFAELDTFGVGYNMALIMVNNSRETPQHTFRAFSTIYDPRRYVH